MNPIHFLSRFILTCSTRPSRSTTAFTNLNNCIIFRELVTFLTEFLSGISRSKTNSTKYVRSIIYCFKMFWIYTMSHSAYMINCISFRNRAVRPFIRQSVNFQILAFNSYISISICILAALPQPAGFSLSDLSPKSFFDHSRTISFENQESRK
jgi:hypothetical protein